MRETTLEANPGAKLPVINPWGVYEKYCNRFSSVFKYNKNRKQLADRYASLNQDRQRATLSEIQSDIETWPLFEPFKQDIDTILKIHLQKRLNVKPDTETYVAPIVPLSEKELIPILKNRMPINKLN